MKGTLRDFKNRLSLSIGIATLLMGIAFVTSFQVLTYNLIHSRSEVASLEFDRLMKQQVSSLANQIAMVVGSAEFRTYVRSGAATRESQKSQFLELIAPLRRDYIDGVEVTMNQDSNIIASLGQTGPSLLAFEVCYIGDRLNGTYGNCIATINIYLQKDEMFSRSLRGMKLEPLCRGCGKALRGWLMGNDQLRFGEKTNITVDLAPAPPETAGLQAFCFALALLIIGYGYWVWRQIGVSITSKIVRPMNELVHAIKSGDARNLSLDDSLSEIVSIQTHHSAAVAVARLTQMLAHDVRKPFSLLRMGLGMLGNAKDPASVKSVLSRLIPEIDKAVSSVDGLIADVMEVGSTSTQLIQEAASPESLIEATLGEIFRVYPKADVTISYDLRHSHMVNVHVQKVRRVFSNIIGNAIQALNQKGEIWFKTHEREDFVEFCIGNAGSVIPPESLPKLFEAFFTSGKKGGTGLGLAIAKKIVTAHGGRIWCESSKTPEHPEGKVEFFFTLPIAINCRSKAMVNLPLHSAEISKALVLFEETAPSDSVEAKGELTLEEDVAEVSAKLKRPLRVLIIDDEAIYRHALAAYLSRTADLSRAIDIVQARGSDEALRVIGDSAPDLVISDIDMGPDSLDGFELVREMRQRGLDGLICIHSNRIVAEDHKTAIKAGADAFLPKAMARAQLLRLTLQAAQQAFLSRQGATAKAVSLAGGKPEVLIVDDNAFILSAWESALEAEAQVHVADSWEAAEELFANDPQLIKRLALVVTDLNFDNSIYDGFGVGKKIKDQRADLPVLLSSDEAVPEADLGGFIASVISKSPVRLERLSMGS